MIMQHFDSVSIHADAYEAKRDGRENIKVEILDFPRSEKLLGSFYMPLATYIRVGPVAFGKLIKARAKHDLKITYDHNSAMGW
jgi:hypothetical protein